MMPTPRWPNSVPSAWTKCQFQYVFDYQQRDPLPNDEVVTAFRDGQVTLRRNRREDGFTNAAKEIGYQHIMAGDLVVHSMDGGFGAIGVSDSDGKASPVVHAYRSEHCDVHFMAYYLKAAVSAGWIAAHTKGIRERSTQFDRASLSRVEVAFPDLARQRSIVEFLGRETAEIDAMDAELNHLIQTLRERSAVVVQRSVVGTEGDVRQRVRLGLLSDEPITAGVDHVANTKADIDLRYIRTTDIRSLRELSNTPVGIPRSSAGSAQVQFDDILLTRSGSLGTSYHHQSAETMAYAGYLVRVRPNIRLCVPSYIAWWTRSRDHLDQVSVGATRSTIDNFSASKFSAMSVPLPPLEEQHRIVAQLDEQTSRIDDMIADANRLKTLLAERRSTLITDVVTGKKEVPA